jgi:hypothetical protein
VYDLPELEPTDRFTALEPLAEVRGIAIGDPLDRLPPGAELAALTEATPDLKRAIVASGTRPRASPPAT